MKRLLGTMALAGLLLAGLALAAPQRAERRMVLRAGPGDGAWLGVQLRDLNAVELKEWLEPDDLGAFVVKVVAESPAEKAGVATGDIIVRYAGMPVLGVEHLIQLVRATPAGKTVSLEVSRKGKKETLPVTLTRREPEEDTIIEIPGFDVPVPPVEPLPPEGPQTRRFRFFSPGERPRLGIYYEDLTEQLGRFFGVPDGKGVLVTSVVEDSPAAKAGLAAGDVIVAIGDRKVVDSGDLVEALRDQPDGQTLTVQAYRKGKVQDFKLTLEPREERTRGRKVSL
jgi:S1-C subfamily serine protease